MGVMTRPRRGLQGSGDTAQIWSSIVVVPVVFLKLYFLYYSEKNYVPGGQSGDCSDKVKGQSVK